MQLEVVSHCWRYSRLLAMQLASFVGSAAPGVQLRACVYFCVRDTATCKIVEYYDRLARPRGVEWDWRPVTHEELANRAIGRQRAAAGSRADVVWFADCDHLIRPDFLPAVEAATRAGVSWHPTSILASSAVSGEKAVADWEMTPLAVARGPQLDLEWQEVNGPGGSMLFAAGAVCRRAGYLPGSSRSLRPFSAGNWRLDADERAVAGQLGPAVAAALPGIVRIRHARRGGPTAVVDF